MDRVNIYGDPIYPGQPGYSTADCERQMNVRRYPIAERIELTPDWCWACGRGWHDRPQFWGGPWHLQHAHLSAGSGLMRRVHDVRAIVLLCPLCHTCHTHRGADMVVIAHEHRLTLSDANVLWLKQTMDPAHWDPVAVAEWWVGAMPTPEEPPVLYEQEYESRRGKR